MRYTLHWEKNFERVTAKEYITPSTIEAVFARYHGVFDGYRLDPLHMHDAFSYQLSFPELGTIIFGRNFVLPTNDSIEQFSFLQLNYNGIGRRLFIEDSLETRSCGLSMFEEWGFLGAPFLNDRGRHVIEDLLSQKDNFVQIPGMRNDDHYFLGDIFNTIQVGYVAGKLKLFDRVD